MKLHLSDFGGGFVIDGYGESFVQIGGERRERSILLTAETVSESGLPSSAGLLTAAHLRPISENIRAEVFLLGAGKTAPPLNPEWLAPFAERGVSLEVMSLPAACRTYNILRGDGREAAAILLIPG